MRTRSPKFPWLLALPLLAQFAASCSCNESSTQPEGNFALAATPAVTAQAGGSGTVQVTVSHSGDFTHEVTLTLEDAPAGVAGTFSQSTVPQGSGTVTLQLTIGSAVPAGTYTMKVCGNTLGYPEHAEQDAVITLTVTAPPAGGFALGLDPSVASLEQGQARTVAVTVTRTAPFAGVVTLVLEGAPAWLTAGFDPAEVAPGASAATLTLSVAPAGVPGTYTLAVRGVATGVSDQTVPLVLTVTQAPGGFTLAAAPGTLDLIQDQGGTVAVTIERTAPFAGPVQLSLEGLPAGGQAGFQPASIPAGSTGSTLTLSLPASVASGTYVVTIRGTGAGVPERTAPVIVHFTVSPGAISLTVNPGALSIAQGGNGTTNISVGRDAPFAGPVNLAVEGAPAGVTAGFNPGPIPAGATQSVLTLTVGPAVATGAYPLTVRATGTGVPAQTAPLTLTVTAAAGFSVSTAPVEVPQGRVGATTVTVVRSGAFAGAVTLALEGGTPGVATTLEPATIPAGATTATITFSVLATVPAGAHPLTLHASAPGVPDQVATVQFTVGAAPAGNVTFAACDESVQPVWFGYQDGNEQWTQVAGQVGSFNFPIHSGKGGVALVLPWPGGGGFDILLVLATQAELTELGGLWCEFYPAHKRLTGNAAGIGFSEWFTVNLGSAWVEVPSSHGTAYELPEAPLGPRDLVAARMLVTSTVPGLTKMIIRRGVDYPAGGVIPLLDFGSGEAFTTTTKTATVQNAGGEPFMVHQAYITAGGTAGQLPHWPSWTDTPPFVVVPSAQALPGDFYNLRIATHLYSGGPTSRTVTRTFVTADDQTLTLGPALAIPSVFDLQAAPLYQVRVVTTLQPEYGNVWSGSYAQDTREGSFYATVGYLGGTTVDVTTPDLRTVPGWNPAWGPVAGVTTFLRGLAYGWSGTTGALFPAFQGDVVTTPNVVVRSAMAYKVVTP